MMICKICNLETSEAGHFWKEHRIKQTDYYAKYEPKFDLLTKELIGFKSEEQYSLVDFANKNNLKKWLGENQNIALDYLFSKLNSYVEFKKSNFVPSQSELRTISFLPIVDTFEFLGKDCFNNLCKNVGLKSKYDYSVPPLEIKEITKIICDTREQKGLIIDGVKITNTCLQFGDYAETIKSKIVIERKSSNDFRGTLSKDFERFKRELERAKKAKAHVVILVESDLNTSIYAKTRFDKVTGDFLAHRMREICREFDNCQFLFSGSRDESKRLIKKILSIGECVKNYDLQFWFERSEL